MNQKILIWLILSVLVVVWGSSFILIKRGLEHFSAIDVGALRVVITFLSLLPFALHKMRGISKSDFYWLSLSGVMGSLIPAFLFAKAQTGIDSATAGLLNSLTPLFTLIAGFVLFKIKMRFINILGIFVGLIGAIGLISVSGGNAFAFNVKYSSYIILATVLYAINVNLIKAKLKHIDALAITSITFFTAGIIASVILFSATDVIEKLRHNQGAWTGLMYIAILAVVGTALAMIAFNTLIKITGPVFASSVTYLIPLVAMMWGVSDGEYFTAQHLLWIGAIICGVALVNLKSFSFPIKTVSKQT